MPTWLLVQLHKDGIYAMEPNLNEHVIQYLEILVQLIGLMKYEDFFLLVFDDGRWLS